jgi:hypothetical protein
VHWQQCIQINDSRADVKIGITESGLSACDIFLLILAKYNSHFFLCGQARFSLQSFSIEKNRKRISASIVAALKPIIYL